MCDLFAIVQRIPYCSLFITYLKHISNLFSVHRCTCLLRITTQQKCLGGKEPELIAIMAPWTWLHNNTDVQFHRTFSKHTPALRFHLKFTTSLIAEPSVHNVFKLFAYWVILYFCRLPIFFPKSTSLKFLSGKPPECQTVWIQIRSELLSGLIWVQAVSNSYQRTTLVGKRKFENMWKNTGWSVKQKFGFRSGGVHVWVHQG